MKRPIETRPEPFTDSRERLAKILTDAAGMLSPDAAGHAPVSIDTVRAILTHVTTTRIPAVMRAHVPRVNWWRFLCTPRTRDDIGRAMLHRLSWHRGRGSAGLWSVYSDLWNVGEETYNTLDTVAAVFVHMFTVDGLKHTLNEKWAGLLARPRAAAQRFKRDYETTVEKGV